jgi:hypothetical protein
MSNPIPPIEREMVPLLEEGWQVQENHISHVAPPLLVRVTPGFLPAWQALTSLGYVRHTVAQQNHINVAIRRHLHQHVEWLVALEKENIELRQQMAEMEAHIKLLRDELSARPPTG